MGPEVVEVVAEDEPHRRLVVAEEIGELGGEFDGQDELLAAEDEHGCVAGWLDVARLQIDVYHTTKQAAQNLARLVQAALADLPGTRSAAVVTAVEPGVFYWNPDPPTGRPAYTFDVLVYLHPIP